MQTQIEPLKARFFLLLSKKTQERRTTHKRKILKKMTSQTPPGIDFNNAALGNNEGVVKSSSINLETSVYRKEDLSEIMKRKDEKVRKSDVLSPFEFIQRKH